MLIRLTFCGLSLAAANAANAATAAQQPDPAPITDVILYPGTATVVRTVAVPAGANQVVLPRLSARFDTQTLRANADAGMLIGEIVIRDQAQESSDNPEQLALEAKQQALQDQLSALEVEAKSADMVRAWLQHLGTASDKPGSAPDAKNLAGLIEGIGRGANDALGKMRRVEIQKRDINKKLDAIKRDLERMANSNLDQRSLVINLHSSQAGNIRVSYQIPDAGWRPAYRADLDSTKANVELTRLASISQKTGEDWRNVRLQLSTGQPRTTPTGPEPQPWLLSYIPENNDNLHRYASVAAPAPPPAPIIQKAPATSRSREPTYNAPTFATQNTFSTEFEVPTRVNLPSDGREIAVTLARQSLPVKQYLRISPRQERAAIIIAEADRPDGVWPAGNVQLFRDNSYAGATAWQPDAGERMSLSFGRDTQVKVALDAVKGNNAKLGIFDKRRERKIADVISISSAHKTPIEIQVLEASPVATSEEIKIKSVFDPKPDSEAWQQKRGVVMWRKTLAPRENAKFNVEYTIEYPATGQVSGL